MKQMTNPLRIVMWGTFDLSNPRIIILERGLCENGVEITRCHHAVWDGIEDKSQVKGLARKMAIAFRWLSAYPLLLYRYSRLPKHDAVIVSYLGHLDVLLLWPFARLRGVPIIWDAFLSLYNTIVEDRRLISVRNPLARFIWAWEWLACRAANQVVLDTATHANYFAQTFGLPKSKLTAVWVGAEPEVFPRAYEPRDVCKTPLVLFYGKFIPLHGIDTIIHAVRLTRGEPIDWVIIGKGQETGKIRALIEANPSPHLRWVTWVNYHELSGWLARATVCLGIFGDTDKADRVIPNKVFQILMSGKPLVTRDSSAIRELIEPEYPGVWLVPPANPQALVEAVRAAIQVGGQRGLHDALRARISPKDVGASFLSSMNIESAD
jgi:glycosyltransferase involved in cell wall biosynthesis